MSDLVLGINEDGLANLSIDILDYVDRIMELFENIDSKMDLLPNYYKGEEAIEEMALSLLRVFDLDQYAQVKANNLPYGKQRKLEIARALATSPKLLLLDEPAAGMNPTETAELMETIKIVREKFSIAILLIEHDMKLVMGICEKIAVLNFGTVLAFGTPDEIKNNPDVIAAYLGDEE